MNETVTRGDVPAGRVVKARSDPQSTHKVSTAVYGVHSIMMEKLAQVDEVGVHALPQSCNVRPS